MSDLGITLGYVIAITTVLGSAAVIALLSLQAIVRAWAFFRPSTKKNEIQSPKERGTSMNTAKIIYLIHRSLNDFLDDLYFLLEGDSS